MIHFIGLFMNSYALCYYLRTLGRRLTCNSHCNGSGEERRIKVAEGFSISLIGFVAILLKIGLEPGGVSSAN